MAQVVETNPPNLRRSAGRLEPLGDLGAVEGVPRLRMGEDQVVVSAEGGPLRPRVELSKQPIGHRDRATRREIGLPLRRMLTQHIRAPHANSLCLPVDVSPTQPQQLGAPEPGHPGR